ncbi:probable 30S ribosomal protein S5 [Coccomyxa sp. Obi]|nr:probable 30S ribosomal protein S5 [Coccomyxa sp. Obi]
MYKPGLCQSATFATLPTGRGQDGLGGKDTEDAADEYGVAAFEADMRQYAEEVKGDEDFEEGATMLDSRQRKDEVDEEEYDELDEDDPLSSMNKTQARFHLTQILKGRYRETPMDHGSKNEEQMEAEMAQFMANFKMQVVDVNRSNKGTRSGGIGRFSTMVAVGNFAGVLGLGVGRSAELADSVKKAYAQASKNLFYVPRFRGHTIIHPVTAKYGRVKVHAYPMTSGSGIRASKLMESICRLAGLQNIGIKIHGSRCARNAVKALFNALEGQQTLSQTQKALGNRRIRELAVGMFLRSPKEKVKGVEGEWYKDFPRPGLRRMPLTAPPSAAELRELVGMSDRVEQAERY